MQLLLCQVHDLHAQPTAATASASLIRMGTAIRMVSNDLQLVPVSSRRNTDRGLRLKILDCTVNPICAHKKQKIWPP